MKIFDLTKGKYKDLYDSKVDSIFDDYISYISKMTRTFSRVFIPSKVDNEELLKDIPVFLVESSMGGGYIQVPHTDLLINIPEDNYVSIEDLSLSDFGINDWLNQKEGQIFNDNDKASSKLKNNPKIEIKDLLGVYLSNVNNKLLPRKIFIWMERIKLSADRTSMPGEDKTQNAVSLFHKVFCHEMAHAMMDVTLYNASPCAKFSYSDSPYRFFEEAYANAIALRVLNRVVSGGVTPFIERFVKSQKDGYFAGWLLYKYHHISQNALFQWMAIKVLFNYDIACLIAKSLKEYYSYRHLKTLKCFESVGYNNWIAQRNRNDKWCLIDVTTKTKVNGFKEYDNFWSFGEDGLCMVRLDHLYGYVNLNGDEQIPVEYDYIYSFENGITIAKKNGWYGAINVNNKTIVLFDNFDRESVEEQIKKL